MAFLPPNGSGYVFKMGMLFYRAFRIFVHHLIFRANGPIAMRITGDGRQGRIPRGGRTDPLIRRKGIYAARGRFNTTRATPSVAWVASVQGWTPSIKGPLASTKTFFSNWSAKAISEMVP